MRRKFNEWRSKHKKEDSARKYSSKWWFWTKEGRSTWDKCKGKGKESPFWKENKCEERRAPAKGSKWWWWTEEGRKVWSRCEDKGEESSFWKENDCSGGR